MYYRIPALELSLSVPLVLQAVFRRAGARGLIYDFLLLSCGIRLLMFQPCFDRILICQLFGPWYSTLFIKVTNPLQFIYEPQFIKHWRNVMFNALVVNYSDWNIFSYSLYFQINMVVTDVRGCQERGGVELLLNTLFGNIEIAGEQVHTKMTLILDKDTGNTEDL